jgi:hypothetical protein
MMSSLLFTKINDWINRTGFCFHSDHVLGYFFGFYYIGVPDRVWSNPILPVENAKELGYGYNDLSKDFDNCNNKPLDCGKSTTICHYNKPEHMYDLFRKENSTLVKHNIYNSKQKLCRTTTAESTQRIFVLFIYLQF